MADELTDNGILSDHPMVTLLDYIDYHGQPVHVGPDRVVFADRHGQELNEWAGEEALNMDRDDLSQRMHELAREVYGRREAGGQGDPWSVRDPVVFDADSFRDDDFEALAVLVAQGLSPAEALDWFATEERSWSQSEWGEWRGKSQQAVSENVAKARDKLDE